MKKFILAVSVVISLFASFAGSIHAGDATLTLDDNAGSSSFVVQDADKTNQFKVNSDGNGYFAGNVGVGTTNPDGKLEVSTSGAKMYISDTTDNGSPGIVLREGGATSGYIHHEGDYLTGYLEIEDYSSAWSTTGLVIKQGNVGIGTASPGNKLEVKDGNFAITNAGWGAWVLKQENISSYGLQSGSFVVIPTEGNHDFGIVSQVVPMAFVVKNSGNVGIGTTSPSEKLEVSGNIKASGTVSQGSSREFKKNIAYVSTKDAINALNKLNPVRFEYKTDDSGEKHLGFIAEDVPDLVAEEDRKHLNSMDITAVLTKVVQEQQKQILEQQKVITTLLNEVNEIKGKI